MADIVSMLLVEQRKRMVATIMGSAEHSAWWPKMSLQEQKAYRQKVLDATGVFYDFCRDVLKCREAESSMNERAVQLIESVHASQRRLEGQLGNGN